MAPLPLEQPEVAQPQERFFVALTPLEMGLGCWVEQLSQAPPLRQLFSPQAPPKLLVQAATLPFPARLDTAALAAP
jgi:hypothetical protein